MKNFILGCASIMCLAYILSSSFNMASSANAPSSNSTELGRQVADIADSLRDVAATQEKYNKLKEEVAKGEKEIQRNHDLNEPINECEADGRDCSVLYANKFLSDSRHADGLE